MTEVDHIRITGIGGVASVIFAPMRLTTEFGKEHRVAARGAQSLAAEIVICDDELPDFRQIDDRQCDFISHANCFAAGGIAVADYTPDIIRADIRVVGNRLDPDVVIPAAGRLLILAGDHIFSDVGQHSGRVDRRHQAGVEADQLERRIVFGQCAGAVERVVNFIERKRIVAVKLVEGYARNAAAAVIPENQYRVVGRIFVKAEADEISEGLAVAHARVGQLADFFKTVRTIEKARKHSRPHRFVMPGLSAAGLYYDVDIIGERCFLQLV